MHRPILISAVATAIFVLWASARSVPAAEPEWKVGLAQVKITPERPTLMAGYAARTKPFEKVASDLYAKALVLEDSSGHRGVIVTSDLIGFPADVAEPICERLRQSTGLAREQILINSSHTHTGPQVSLKPPEQDEPAGEAARTIEYTHALQDKVVALVEQAAQKLEPAALAWGSGVVHFVMNRREFTPEGVKLGANPRGLADRSVPVLQVSAPDGTLRAVLFGAAVHNTTPRSDYFQICADYAGYAQTLIQEKHPGAEALFMLGCAGDADPYPFGNIELARQHGTELGLEVCRVLDSKKLSPVRGPLQMAFARAELPLVVVPSREELRKMAADKRSPKTWGAARMLEMIDRGQKPPTHYAAPIAVWQFGSDLTLVGLSGEVVVDFVPLIEKALGANRLWIAAYCNDVFGYLPSARVLKEGGYETRGLYTGGAGFFSPEAQEVVVRTVRELATKAGRSLPAE